MAVSKLHRSTVPMQQFKRCPSVEYVFFVRAKEMANLLWHVPSEDEPRLDGSMELVESLRDVLSAGTAGRHGFFINVAGICSSPQACKCRWA